MNDLITYKVNEPITTEEFIEVLKTSTLAERRPINDLKCMKGMVENSNLTVSAIYGDKLIGITMQQLGIHCKLILISAPAAIDYYPKLGFKKHPQAWYLDNEEEL